MTGYHPRLESPKRLYNRGYSTAWRLRCGYGTCPGRLGTLRVITDVSTPPPLTFCMIWEVTGAFLRARDGVWELPQAQVTRRPNELSWPRQHARRRDGGLARDERRPPLPADIRCPRCKTRQTVSEQHLRDLAADHDHWLRFRQKAVVYALHQDWDKPDTLVRARERRDWQEAIEGHVYLITDDVSAVAIQPSVELVPL